MTRRSLRLPRHIAQMKSVVTQQEMDKAYNDAVACLLRPRNRVHARERPARWRRFWTRELQQLSQWRKALWKKWKRRGDVDALSRHKELDKEIKTNARREQRRGFGQFMYEIDTMPMNLPVGTLSRLVKSRTRRKSELLEAVQRIEPRAFTAFVVSQHDRRDGERGVTSRAFGVDDDWGDDIKQAL